MSEQGDTIPKAAGIYKITCTITNKIYIGSATDLRRRKRDHFLYLSRNTHKNRKLQAAWNKYGAETFLFEIIELVSDLDMLIIREQFWLDTLKPFDDGGYNLAFIAGSTRGIKYPAEAVERSAAKHRGKKQTPESNAKRSATLKGVKRGPFSEEHRRKLSEAKQGQMPSFEARAKQSAALKGRKHSPEHIAKRAAARRGSKHPPEARAKISAKAKGRKQSPEVIEKRAAAIRGRKHPPRSEGWRRKLSEAKKGTTQTPESNAKRAASLRGRKQSPEHTAKALEGKRRAKAMRESLPNAPTLWDEPMNDAS